MKMKLPVFVLSDFAISTVRVTETAEEEEWSFVNNNQAQISHSLASFICKFSIRRAQSSAHSWCELIRELNWKNMSGLLAAMLCRTMGIAILVAIYTPSSMSIDHGQVSNRWWYPWFGRLSIAMCKTASGQLRRQECAASLIRVRGNDAESDLAVTARRCVTSAPTGPLKPYSAAISFTGDQGYINITRIASTSDDTQDQHAWGDKLSRCSEISRHALRSTKRVTRRAISRKSRLTNTTSASECVDETNKCLKKPHGSKECFKEYDGWIIMANTQRGFECATECRNAAGELGLSPWCYITDEPKFWGKFVDLWDYCFPPCPGVPIPDYLCTKKEKSKEQPDPQNIVQNDFVLIRLEKPVKFTKEIRPIQLAGPDEDIYVHHHRQQCYVAGYGAIANEDGLTQFATSKKLRTSEVRILPTHKNGTCSLPKLPTDWTTTFVPKHAYCSDQTYTEIRYPNEEVGLTRVCSIEQGRTSGMDVGDFGKMECIL